MEEIHKIKLKLIKKIRKNAANFYKQNQIIKLKSQINN